MAFSLCWHGLVNYFVEKFCNNFQFSFCQISYAAKASLKLVVLLLKVANCMECRSTPACQTSVFSKMLMVDSEIQPL